MSGPPKGILKNRQSRETARDDHDRYGHGHQEKNFINLDYPAGYDGGGSSTVQSPWDDLLSNAGRNQSASGLDGNSVLGG